MILLAVETSGPVATIALAGNIAPIERTLSDAGRRHALTLVSEVGALLTDSDLHPRNVTVVAVSIGPGSFTGLRVGVVFAKTFAWATRASLVAIDTLQAIAAGSPPDVNEVWILSDALRGDVYLGRYRRSDSDALFVREGDVSITPFAEWLDARRPGEIVSGPGASKLRIELESHGLRVLNPSCLNPRAAVVARIGLAQLAAGNAADVDALEPFYLRRPAAEETRAPETGA